MVACTVSFEILYYPESVTIKIKKKFEKVKIRMKFMKMYSSFSDSLLNLEKIKKKKNSVALSFIKIFYFEKIHIFIKTSITFEIRNIF